MAIRLRRIKGRKVALCAARTKAQPDDIYLDDAWDHSLRAKFCKDYISEGVTGLSVRFDPELDRLMAKEEGDGD